MERHHTAGPVALVGSGEFLRAMEGVDRALLDRLGGPGRARVVVLPTASGLEEPGSSARWMDMGIEHFARLGAQVEAAAILNRDDAADPRWLPRLGAADFFYFSGGNPQHVIETMAGSPAWEVIRRRHRAGAVLAGCSAGAMAICGRTASIRALRDGGLPEWLPALGVLPGLIVMPHFDRVAEFVSQAVFERVVASIPAGMALIGIDEETALVRLEGADPRGSRWQVLGAQTVVVFDCAGARPARYRAGEMLQLPE